MLPPVQNRSLWPESHSLGIEKCAWVCPSYTWLPALVCSCLHVCARVRVCVYRPHRLSTGLADGHLVGGLGSSWRLLVPLWCLLPGWLDGPDLVTSPFPGLSAFQPWRQYASLSVPCLLLCAAPALIEIVSHPVAEPLTGLSMGKGTAVSWIPRPTSLLSGSLCGL